MPGRAAETRSVERNTNLSGRRRPRRPNEKDLHTPTACPPVPQPQSGSAQKSLDEVVRLAQQGDAEAFEAIYKQYSRRVYALCLRMLGDPTEAEDVVQEAFLQLFRKIHTFRGESAFSSWLHRLTANIVLMRFRKKRPHTVSLDELTRGDEDNGGTVREFGAPDPRMRSLVDRVNLQRAIRRLPAGYKRMLLLHDLDGYEHNEIAAILNCSVGNSKSQVHKSRKKLREFLEPLKRGRAEAPGPAGCAVAAAVAR